MAYNTALPPALIAGKLNTGARIWMYQEAGLAMTAVDLSGYITNAKALGMAVDDLVFHCNPTSHIWSSHVVLSINATTGAADLSDGTVIAAGGSNAD